MRSRVDSFAHLCVVGRRTFPIALGVGWSNRVYALFAASAHALIIGLVATGYRPKLSLIALASLPFSLFAFYGAIKRNTRIGENAQYLGANIIATLLTPLLLSVSLFY